MLRTTLTDGGAGAVAATTDVEPGKTPSPMDPAAAKPTDAEPQHGVLQLDFEPTFSTLQSQTRVALEWRDVRYAVKQKEILKGVSGQANPGDVVAIMGPSGAGKSTLLNILAGRLGKRRGRVLTGEFRANGEAAAPRALSERIAYVMQEDALFATATARESLEFSARLRLPASVTADERRALVDDILASLGLTRVQHTMVGSDLIRGLSGGEKKRVSIGVELVSSPSMLFLDEPTSGLDSYSAWKVVRILNALAGRTAATRGSRACTVLCSIHQPSSEVFREFSHLILLGQGRVVFQGALGDVAGVFAQHGLPVPPNTNIADHVMLCTQTRPPAQLPSDDANQRAPRPVLVSDGRAGGSWHSRSWVSRVGSMAGVTSVTSSGERRASIAVQAWELAAREFKSIARDRAGTAARFLATGILNVLFAIIFLGAADVRQDGYTAQSALGAVVMMNLSALFGTAQPALLQFPLEKVTFLRERGLGMYSTTVWVFAKLLVEAPLSLATALCVCCC